MLLSALEWLTMTSSSFHSLPPVLFRYFNEIFISLDVVFLLKWSNQTNFRVVWVFCRVIFERGTRKDERLWPTSWQHTCSNFYRKTKLWFGLLASSQKTTTRESSRWLRPTRLRPRILNMELPRNHEPPDRFGDGMEFGHAKTAMRPHCCPRGPSNGPASSAMPWCIQHRSRNVRWKRPGGFS